jgi:small subunit ribosomal protein S18
MADEATLTEAQEEQESEKVEEETKEPAKEENVAEAVPTPKPAPTAAPSRPSGGRPPGRGPRQQDRRGGGRGRGRWRPRRKVCSFCVDKVTHIDYKQVDTLRRFVDGHGKIIPRRKTGTCAKHQRRLALAIKYSRHLALLPYAAGRSPYD